MYCAPVLQNARPAKTDPPDSRACRVTGASSNFDHRGALLLALDLIAFTSNHGDMNQCACRNKKKDVEI